MRKRIEEENPKRQSENRSGLNLQSDIKNESTALCKCTETSANQSCTKSFYTSKVYNNVLQLFWGTLMSLLDVVVRSALGKLLDQLSEILYALQFIWNMRHNYLKYLVQFIWNMRCVYQFSTPQSIFLMGLQFLELTKELNIYIRRRQSQL